MTLPRIDRLLVAAPRGLLVACLVFAPWAYGAVRPWAMRDLAIVMGTIVVLWGLECCVRRRRPEMPGVAVAAVAGLLLQGWWMTWNARSQFDADVGALLPLTPRFANAPGSVDGPASLSAMIFFTTLLGLFLFCCDLFRHPIWQKRIVATMVLTGFSIAALGLLQKIGGVPMLALTWETGKQDVTNNFAMYRYRGNAGAFLNIVFPLAVGWTFLLFQRRHRPWSQALVVSGLFLLVLGIQMNPSRASWFIFLLLACALAGKLFCWWKSGRDAGNPRRGQVLAVMGAFCLLAIVTISAMGNWETSWNRWNVLGFDVAERSPVEIYLRMVPDAGVLGFGAGTFGTLFPSYQETYDFGGRPVPPFWKQDHFTHAHNDYLETLIEWGYLGTLLWTMLVLGGIIRGVRRHFRKETSSSARWLLFCSLLALGGTLTQACVDFPLQIASIQLYVFALLAMCWEKGSAPAEGRICAGRSSFASSRSTTPKVLTA
jgi:O-antigen ligase